jgi:hypothetical protein
MMVEKSGKFGISVSGERLDVDSTTLQVVTEILTQMKMVKTVINLQENEVYYKYLGKKID